MTPAPSVPVRLERRRPSRRPSCVRTLAAAAALAAFPPSAGADEPRPLRFGFTSEVFVEVNENDARASLKIWAQTLGREQGIPVDIDLPILAGTASLREALANGQVDAATMTAIEYRAVRESVPLDSIILGRMNGEFTEEYLLLVHRDDPAAAVADLRGRSLSLQHGSRTCLASIWLDTLLLDAGLGPTGAFWGSVTRAAKLTRVVLPVFFRQADACVVTRRGFDTMSELNPQVGRQLRILATSPAVVPVIFALRSDVISPLRDRLLENITKVGGTPTGRQTLALFQTDTMEVRPVSDLAATLDLLDRHARLRRGAGLAPAPASP